LLQARLLQKYPNFSNIVTSKIITKIPPILARFCLARLLLKTNHKVEKETPPMENMNYKSGDRVWCHFPWVDEDCWVTGTVVKVTAKRVVVHNDVRGVGYYAPHNVKLAEG
jgi:hypothetical protein